MPYSQVQTYYLMTKLQKSKRSKSYLSSSLLLPAVLLCQACDINREKKQQCINTPANIGHTNKVVQSKRFAFNSKSDGSRRLVRKNYKENELNNSFSKLKKV